MKKLARNALSFVLVALLFLLVWQRRHELTPVFKDPSSDLLLLGALIVVGHFLNSAEFWVVYRATNVRIGFFENWMVFTSGLLGNLLPGQMGTLYKFRYMKQVHHLPYAKSGSNYGANLIISLGSSAIVGTIGVFGNKISGDSFSLVMLLCFLGLGVVCIATLRLSLPTWKVLSGKPAKIFSTFSEGWDEIRRTPRTTLQVISIDVVKYRTGAAITLTESS